MGVEHRRAEGGKLAWGTPALLLKLRSVCVG